MLALVSKGGCWLEKQQSDYYGEIKHLCALILETLEPNKNLEVLKPNIS